MKTDASSFLSDDEIQLVFQHSDQSKENDNDIRFMITNVVLSSSDGQTQDFTLNNAEAFLKIIPDQFALHSIYPNPFNPITNISYELSNPSRVTITIYDLKGREVKTIVNEWKQPGYYSTVWNSTDDRNNPVSSGIYFYRMKTNTFHKTLKMLLIK